MIDPLKWIEYGFGDYTGLGFLDSGLGLYESRCLGYLL